MLWPAGRWPGTAVARWSINTRLAADKSGRCAVLRQVRQAGVQLPKVRGVGRCTAGVLPPSSNKPTGACAERVPYLSSEAWCPSQTGRHATPIAAVGVAVVQLSRLLASVLLTHAGGVLRRPGFAQLQPRMQLPAAWRARHPQ